MKNTGSDTDPLAKIALMKFSWAFWYRNRFGLDRQERYLDGNPQNVRGYGARCQRWTDHHPFRIRSLKGHRTFLGQGVGT